MLIDVFVTNMVAILGLATTKYEQFVETIKVFKKFLRADPKVFKRFKANVELLKKMDISKHVKVSKDHDKKIHS